jgi:lysine biosynthesis protein LysW
MMNKTICPVCNKNIKVESIYLFKQVRCPECKALLEVVEEDPLKLEEVFAEEEGKEDDGDDKDDEDDEDEEDWYVQPPNEYLYLENLLLPTIDDRP